MDETFDMRTDREWYIPALVMLNRPDWPGWVEIPEEMRSGLDPSAMTLQQFVDVMNAFSDNPFLYLIDSDGMLDVEPKHP